MRAFDLLLQSPDRVVFALSVNKRDKDAEYPEQAVRLVFLQSRLPSQCPGHALLNFKLRDLLWILQSHDRYTCGLVKLRLKRFLISKAGTISSEEVD